MGLECWSYSFDLSKLFHWHVLNSRVPSSSCLLLCQQSLDSASFSFIMCSSSVRLRCWSKQMESWMLLWDLPNYQPRLGYDCATNSEVVWREGRQEQHQAPQVPILESLRLLNFVHSANFSCEVRRLDHLATSLTPSCGTLRSTLAITFELLLSVHLSCCFKRRFQAQLTVYS